jgi:hypothetical protein
VFSVFFAVKTVPVFCLEKDDARPRLCPLPQEKVSPSERCYYSVTCPTYPVMGISNKAGNVEALMLPPIRWERVAKERRHLKKSGKVCGGLPTRRYGKVESSAAPGKSAQLKNRPPFEGDSV